MRNMKTRVLVELVATKEVEIVIEHEAGDDPTDLNWEEENAARDKAAYFQDDWTINSVVELGPADDK